jgi:hypothetical protein
MSETKPQAITYVPKDIWDQRSCPPSSYGKSVDYFILGSCRNNYHDDVKKHFHLTKWTPFELMIITIHGLAYRQLHTFAFLLPKLQKTDATRTFLLPNGEEHTLLTLFCARAAVYQVNPRDAFCGLLELGCQWDQEVQGDKTALSFLVRSGDNKLIEWCIGKGATLQKGHLLVYASKGLTKRQYEERAEIEKTHRYLATNGMTPLADPETVHPPFNNKRMFRYLVENGAPVNDVDHTTGMTPLITACCEDNPYKVRLLLQHGAVDSLYRQNNEGMDAFAFAKLQEWKYVTVKKEEAEEDDDTVMQKAYEQQEMAEEDDDYYSFMQKKNKEEDEDDISLLNLLRSVETEQKQYWTELLEEVQLEVPFRELLQVVAKI